MQLATRIDSGHFIGRKKDVFGRKCVGKQELLDFTNLHLEN